MIDKFRNQCTACAACKTVCPEECIVIDYDKEGFFYPKINIQKCKQCGACEDICHCACIPVTDTARKSFFGYSDNNDVLASSSSGGAFYHLARVILGENGLVVGAAFDYRNRVLKHVTSDDVDIKYIQKSKYVESFIGDIHQQIQSSIDKGRRVLFCGAPCQVSGLLKVINDPNSLLFTCDFVCHGVPSQMLFREHLYSLCKNKEIINIDFRPKCVPWERKFIKISGNNWNYFKPYTLDSFYSGFMAYNAFLRESCYDCRFRKNHISDITLADFWAWKEYDPTLETCSGLSLLVSNTDKGITLIKQMRNFNITEIDNSYSEYIYRDKDYSAGWELRKKFYMLYYKYGFEKAARQTFFNNVCKRNLKYLIKKILKLDY